MIFKQMCPKSVLRRLPKRPLDKCEAIRMGVLRRLALNLDLKGSNVPLVHFDGVN